MSNYQELSALDPRKTICKMPLTKLDTAACNHDILEAKLPRSQVTSLPYKVKQTSAAYPVSELHRFPFHVYKSKYDPHVCPYTMTLCTLHRFPYHIHKSVRSSCLSIHNDPGSLLLYNVVSTFPLSVCPQTVNPLRTRRGALMPVLSCYKKTDIRFLN